jgi:hypothetical protein
MDWEERFNCADPFRVSSYFDRLWTRQEIHYSHEVSVVWCSNTSRPSTKTTSKVDSLAPYARELAKCSKARYLEMRGKRREFVTRCHIAILQSPALEETSVQA